MLANRFTALAFTGVFILGACAQTTIVEDRITYQPIYNKFGEPVGCEGGLVWNPNMPVGDECRPPEEDCDPQLDPNCLPVDRGGGPNRPQIPGTNNPRPRRP